MAFFVQDVLCAPLHDRVRVAGSISMYPVMTAVAERFAYETGEKSPVVEATGTGGGIRVFCSGTGGKFPDIVAASRPMNAAEKDFCRKNGVVSFHEILFGFDGIVLAHAAQSSRFPLSFIQLQRALGTGGINLKMWSDLDKELPRRNILLFGPSSTSGTREALEMILAGKKGEFHMRDDGRYVDMPEQENVIAQKLLIEPEALGIFSYGFYEKNHHRLRAVRIDGVRPTHNTIANGKYPLSRPLYIYVKKCSSNPCRNLELFMEMLLSPMTSGPDGYLRGYGFIALPAQKHALEMQRALQFLREHDNQHQ